MDYKLSGFKSTEKRSKLKLKTKNETGNLIKVEDYENLATSNCPYIKSKTTDNKGLFDKKFLIPESRNTNEELFKTPKCEDDSDVVQDLNISVEKQEMKNGKSKKILAKTLHEKDEIPFDLAEVDYIDEPTVMPNSESNQSLHEVLLGIDTEVSKKHFISLKNKYDQNSIKFSNSKKFDTLEKFVESPIHGPCSEYLNLKAKNLALKLENSRIKEDYKKRINELEQEIHKTDRELVLTLKKINIKRLKSFNY